MSALKQPEIILHSIFQEGSDLAEIVSCVTAFMDGDPGIIRNDEQVLGFMRRGMEGKSRHGVYETHTGGRIHVVGDDRKIMAMPDVVFAQGTKDSECSINACTCGKHDKKKS